jgi:urea transport system ATP-binding protein
MLEIRNLHVGYGQSEVIHGLDFIVGDNEILAVMGRNGMGKTTLFKSLIGILPTRSGSIRLKGKELMGEESYLRVRQGLAYVPQGRMIFPALTVEENIRTGLDQTGERAVPKDLYDIFPVLYDMRKRRGGNLSGGQQQQLAIARALAANPAVLLLDEPTEGIQPSIIKDLARTLNRIREIRKLSILVSEQVLSFTLEIADRLLVIEKGAFVHEAERKDVDVDSIAQYLSV